MSVFLGTFAVSAFIGIAYYYAWAYKEFVTITLLSFFALCIISYGYGYVFRRK
jgi:hypothetical protein